MRKTASAKLRLLVRRTDRILIGAKIQICAYANTRIETKSASGRNHKGELYVKIYITQRFVLWQRQPSGAEEP